MEPREHNSTTRWDATPRSHYETSELPKGRAQFLTTPIYSEANKDVRMEVSGERPIHITASRSGVPVGQFVHSWSGSEFRMQGLQPGDEISLSSPPYNSAVKAQVNPDQSSCRLT